MARDILGKSLFVDDDICNCDANEEQVEHTGASVTNAEADAAAPMVAAAAVATNDFIFHYSTGLLWEEMRGLHGRANKTHVEPDGRTESDIQSSESITLWVPSKIFLERRMSQGQTRHSKTTIFSTSKLFIQESIDALLCFLICSKLYCTAQ